MKTLTNAVLIGKLQSANTRENEEAMSYIYASLYGKVKTFVIRNNGQIDEAKDLFQDALMAFYKMVKRNRITEEVRVEAYVFTICRNLWFKQLQKKKKTPDFTVSDLIIPVEEGFSQQAYSVDKSELLSKVIDKLTDGCKTILKAFYYQRMSMEQIVESMKLSSTQIAKNKKYKCMQSLKKVIADSDYYKNNLI